MALGETAELAVRLSLDDRFSRGIGGAQKALGRFEGHVTKTRQNLTNLAKVGVAGLATGFVGSLKVAGDFEAQLNTINTVARATPPVLEKIGKGIRELARDTGTATEDLTQGYYDLVSAGIAAADAQGVLKAANTLAIGGLATTAETVDLLTTALNTYGIEASKAGEVSDIFAKSIERGKVTAAELAASFAQVGPIAAASGIELEELGAAYAQLTASGVPAAEAATQVRSAIVALTKRTGDLERLEKATGRSYLALAGKKGLVVALEQMRKDAAKAGVPLIDLLGRVEGLNFTLATTGGNFADYNQNLAEMGKASGTAAAQMAERQQGLNFQLARLKALAKDAGITIGTALIPKLVPLIEKFNTFLSQNQGKIEKFAGELAQGFETLGKAVQGVDFKAIGDGLRITGQAAKVAVDAFMSLPPDLQKLAIAALAVNKLSGGLVTSGIGAIANLALHGLKTIVAGNVTVIGKNVVGGGVPGVAPTPGKASSLGSKLVKGAGAVFVVGIAGEAASSLLQPVISETTQKFLATAPTKQQIADQIATLKVLKRQAEFNIAGINTGFDPFGTAASFQQSIDELTAVIGTGLNRGTFGERPTASAADARFRELADMRDSLRTIVTNTAKAARTPEAIDTFRKATARVGTSTPFREVREAAKTGDKTILPVVQNLARSLAAGNSPWARDLKVMTGHLANLKELEAGFIARGDTKSAATVRTAITTLQGALDARIGETKTTVATATNNVKSAVSAVGTAVGSLKGAAVPAIGNIAAKVVNLLPALGGIKGAAAGTAQAIRDKDLSVSVTANTTVTTNVSVRDLGVNTSRKSKFGYSHV